MTLEKQETKKGGPYTKTEQEQRRSKVYDLYFEKGLPAIKIADELGVNRNTINADIQILLSQVTVRLGADRVMGTILTQIQRLEIQRKRLLDTLDSNDFKKSIVAEKLLLQIEKEISSLMLQVRRRTNVNDYAVEDPELPVGLNQN